MLPRKATSMAVPRRDTVKELGDWPVVYALAWTLGRASRPLGRRTLTQMTGISEMTVRTHLNKLRAVGYVQMAKAGTSLTAPGREAFSPLRERVRWVGALTLRELSLDAHGAAALVRNISHKLKESWRYRDAAVRAGATGALLLVRVRVPDGDGRGWAFGDEPLPLADRYPQDAALLHDLLPSSEPGDALVVAFAPDPAVARRALWRIVVELLPPSTLKLAPSPAASPERSPSKGG